MACGEPDGPDRERPYQFAPIVSRLARAKSADDSDSDAEEAGDALKRGVGTILVEFRTCRIGKAMDYFPNLGGPAEGRAVTERGVKGQLVHKTSFGQAREAKGTSYLDFDLIGHVICAFEFRYRSQGTLAPVCKRRHAEMLQGAGLLEADGIAEASPEPVPERAAGDVKPKIEGNVEHAAVADPQPQAEAQPAVTGGPGPSGSGLDAAADVKPKVGAATAAARGKRTPSSPPENGDASDAKPQDSDATADKGKKRARTDDLDRVQDDEMERLRRENRMLMVRPLPHLRSISTGSSGDAHAGADDPPDQLPHQPRPSYHAGCAELRNAEERWIIDRRRRRELGREAGHQA